MDKAQAGTELHVVGMSRAQSDSLICTPYAVDPRRYRYSSKSYRYRKAAAKLWFELYGAFALQSHGRQ